MNMAMQSLKNFNEIRKILKKLVENFEKNLMGIQIFHKFPGIKKKKKVENLE